MQITNRRLRVGLPLWLPDELVEITYDASPISFSATADNECVVLGAATVWVSKHAFDINNTMNLTGSLRYMGDKPKYLSARYCLIKFSSFSESSAQFVNCDVWLFLRFVADKEIRQQLRNKKKNKTWEMQTSFMPRLSRVGRPVSEITAHFFGPTEIWSQLAVAPRMIHTQKTNPRRVFGTANCESDCSCCIRSAGDARKYSGRHFWIEERTNNEESNVNKYI